MSDNSPEKVRALVEASPFHTWFGMGIADIGEGYCDVEIEVDERHHNLIGSAHGGVVSTLSDTAIGLAVRTTIPEGYRHLTTQLTVTYLEKVESGKLLARGRVVRSGRRFAYGEADVVGAGDRLVARASATFTVLAVG